MQLRLLLIAGASFGLAACQTNASEVAERRAHAIANLMPPPQSAQLINNAPSTAHITDEQAIAMARGAIIARLKDPDSAKFGSVFKRKIVIVPDDPDNGINKFSAEMNFPLYRRTDLVCGSINARNSFGGYAGASVFAYRLVQKDVWIDEPNDRYGSMWCTGENISKAVIQWKR